MGPVRNTLAKLSSSFSLFLPRATPFSPFRVIFQNAVISSFLASVLLQPRSFQGVPFFSPLADIEHRCPKLFSSDTAVLLLLHVSTFIATRKSGSIQETASHSLL